MTFSPFLASPLVLRGVSHGYGDRLLLDSVDLTIAPGEHVVVIGENGAGKSTLLRLIAKVELPDAGTVNAVGHSSYLGQEQRWPEGFSIQDALDDALTGIRAIEAELEALQRRMADAELADAELADAEPEDTDRYDELATLFALRGGYQAEAMMAAALDRLGLTGLARTRAVESLSGGEAGRLALACLLADPAPVLLLDEPTNHLDAAGLDWLENRLSAHRGTVVVVSHDRVLLRKLAQTVIEVDADRAEVRRYGNGYDGYLAQKRVERTRWEQSYQQWLDAMGRERDKIVAVPERNGYGRHRDNAKMEYDFKSGTVQEAIRSQVRNAQERLRRLAAAPIDRPPAPLRLAARLGSAAGHEAVIELEQVLVPGRLEIAELTISATEKLLITGPNGAGKTTLLNVLAGVGEPMAQGTVRRRALIGYLPQEVPVPSRPDRRLLPAFAAGRVGDIDEQAEVLLRLGLFRSADFSLPVGTLSVGQSRRLALARLLLGEFEVLMLDEPTNHLAPQLVDDLQELFSGFNGSLIMVSHDRALREWFSGSAGSRQLELVCGSVAK